MGVTTSESARELKAGAPTQATTDRKPDPDVQHRSAFYRVGITWSLMLLPGLALLLSLLALGVGMFLSALHVKYRDIRHALPFLVQIWMFASPVIYPTTLVPGKWRWVLALNPMTGIIEGFRTALLGGKAIEWNLLAISAAVTFILLIYSALAFKRMEKSFADVI